MTEILDNDTGMDNLDNLDDLNHVCDFSDNCSMSNISKSNTSLAIDATDEPYFYQYVLTINPMINI